VARLYLRRTLGGFEPADEPSREAWKRYKLGESYRADVVKPRNYKFHKLCFALLTLTFENQEQYHENQFKSFRRAVALKAGHYDEYIDLDGELRQDARSLSYDELDDLEFEALFPKMMDVCARILHNMNKADLEREVIQYAVDRYGYNPNER
jgi:hypothetical protein